MARGWWIDPRSSYKMDESITYDPYTFETSGGTMFFSQSNESKSLTDMWIKETNKLYQQGKADDRILSLIFNTYKLLLPMKIIQLPIEYLWLTLDYNDRLLETLYDYNYKRMNETIFIEHPECLTTEETAAGAGASSDRTPKFYSFLDIGELSPVSEEVHEYVMFPDKEMTSSFKDYFNYMENTLYIDDGNEILYKKGLVDKEHQENNESPLYVIKYDDKFGNKQKDYDGEKLSPNEVSEINLKRANNMNLESLKTQNILKYSPDEKFVEIEDINSKLEEKELISLIIRLLNDGKEVLFNPSNKSGYNKELYNFLIEEKDKRFKSLEFLYVTKKNDQNFYFSDFFKSGIQTNNVILFKPSNKILIDLLSMFFSLDELSNLLEYGCYEFISRIRIGYLNIFIKKKSKTDISLSSAKPNINPEIQSSIKISEDEEVKPEILQKGGLDKEIDEIDGNNSENYNSGFEILYGDVNQNAGKIKYKKTRKQNKTKKARKSRKHVKHIK
jgi:hypothetical protein